MPFEHSFSFNGSEKKQGVAKDYMTARAGTINIWVAAQDTGSSIQDQVAGMPEGIQTALLQTIMAAPLQVSKSVAAIKGVKH
jgi:hypothetical protein